MFWLALGTFLLLWSALAGPGPRLDFPAGLSLALLVALSVAAIRIYPARTEAASLIGGTIAAALALWFSGRNRAQSMRWAALFAGLGAGLFSIFGPAQGLFA